MLRVLFSFYPNTFQYLKKEEKEEPKTPPRGVQGVKNYLNFMFVNFPDGAVSHLHSISDSLKSLSFNGSNSGLRLAKVRR